ALAQLHHDVQKVHAIEFHLLAQGNVVLQAAQILVRRDVRKYIQDGRANFGGTHAAISPTGSAKKVSGTDFAAKSVPDTFLLVAFDDHHGIDAEHSERIVQDVIDAAQFMR